MDESVEKYIDLIAKVIIDNVNKVAQEHLQDNKRKMIVFYTMKCEFCLIYLDELKKYDDQYKDKPEYIPYELFDMEKAEYYQFGKALKFKGIPATAYVDTDNKIKGLVSGIVPYNEIINTVNRIYNTAKENENLYIQVKEVRRIF